MTLIALINWIPSKPCCLSLTLTSKNGELLGGVPNTCVKLGAANILSRYINYN